MQTCFQKLLTRLAYCSTKYMFDHSHLPLQYTPYDSSRNHPPPTLLPHSQSLAFQHQNKFLPKLHSGTRVSSSWIHETGRLSRKRVSVTAMQWNHGGTVTVSS